MAIPIGSKIPDFRSLKSTDGRLYGLSDFKEAKLLLVIFSCNHCPYVKAYESRYKAIQEKFAPAGLVTAVINSNDAVKYPDDSFEKMQERAESESYNFPYLHDADQSVARGFGASNTPHVFLFDQDKTLRYSGRIDDNWEHEEDVQNRDLENAIRALLEGKKPQVDSTLPVGCSIKWK